MAVIYSRLTNGQRLVTYYQTGEADTALTLASTAVAEHRSQKLCYVAVAYSDSPTQTGVTTTIDNVLGAGYDCLLNTGTANARYTAYIPDGTFRLNSGDILSVTAPAAGGVITASITIVMKES